MPTKKRVSFFIFKDNKGWVGGWEGGWGRGGGMTVGKGMLSKVASRAKIIASVADSHHRVHLSVVFLYGRYLVGPGFLT
jgi:hypothetical protein